MNVTPFSNEAWFLQSVFHSDKGSGTSLANIIATGDYINRAIFTFAEINSALGNLIGMGLIRFENKRVFANDEAKTLFESLRPKSRSLQKETGLLATKLQLVKFETEIPAAENLFSKTDYDAALEQYLR